MRRVHTLKFSQSFKLYLDTATMTLTGQEYPAYSALGRCMPLLGVNFVHAAVGGNAYYTCGVGVMIIHVGVGFALPLYV